tara:strand:+ start:478 stop:1422 length:945 start_codon:yes stop_codon:yes gene_type:complete
MKSFKKLRRIKGDASFRSFYRDDYNNSIKVFSSKEKTKNLLIYDAVNRILIKNKILSPQMLSQNYSKNYIEIEDFGNETLFKILQRKSVNKYFIFKKIIKVLNKIQIIKNKKIKNFKNQTYKIKEYKKQILYNEAKLFSDWYVVKKLSKLKGINFNKKFKKEIKNLLSKLSFKNDTFVHRDFHVSNLMYVNNNIGVIDSQDALIGNKAYDLASLIDDVRLKTSYQLKEKIFNYYIKTNAKIEIDKFKKDFEILSILRNLKIIGIFMRLAVRDNKKKYLKLIPYAWEMISYRIKKKKDFRDLMILLKSNFPKLIG